jgi:hypothetical protein
MKIEDIHYDLQPIPVDEENFDIEKMAFAESS